MNQELVDPSVTHVYSAFDVYLSWGISRLTNGLLREVAKDLARKSLVTPDVYHKLFAILHDRFQELADENLKRESGDVRFIRTLRGLQGKRLCWGRYCPLYKEHGIHNHNPSKVRRVCMSIGALRLYLLSLKLYPACEAIDRHFLRHGLLRQFGSPIQICQNLCVRAKYKYSLGADRSVIQILADYNSLSEEDIRAVHRLAVEKNLKVQMFVIPKWNIGLCRRWMDFVNEQIRSLSPRSVVVMKLCCEFGVDPESDDELDVENINQPSDAVRYIRQLVKEYRRYSVDVNLQSLHYGHDDRDQGFDGLDLDDDIELHDLDRNENVEAGFVERDLPCNCQMSRYKTLIALLTCPFWAREYGVVQVT